MEWSEKYCNYYTVIVLIAGRSPVLYFIKVGVLCDNVAHGTGLERSVRICGCTGIYMM